MHYAVGMPYLSAHLLDRCNEWIVAWRLRGRSRSADQAAVEAYLGKPASDLFPGPIDLPPLIPEERGSGLWVGDSPWKEAAGANRRWKAHRFPTDGSTGATDPPPVLILLHGWLISRLPLMIYRSWARQMARQGIEVWMPQMPHHLGRAEPSDISGERFLSADLPASLDSVRQAVAETRCLGAWLRERGAPRVGLWGTSLGGWVGALAATLEDYWAAVALWAPVASPAEVLWESRLARRMRSAVIDAGLRAGDEKGTRLELLTPESCLPLVERERLLVIGAIHDSIVSPASISRMARRWNCDIRWVPHGHIGLMAAPAVVADTVSFLREGLRPTG